MKIEIVLRDNTKGHWVTTTRVVQSEAVAVAMLSALFMRLDPWQTDPMLHVDAVESHGSDGSIRIEVTIQ